MSEPGSFRYNKLIARLPSIIASPCIVLVSRFVTRFSLSVLLIAGIALGGVPTTKTKKISAPKKLKSLEPERARIELELLKLSPSLPNVAAKWFEPSMLNLLLRSSLDPTPARRLC